MAGHSKWANIKRRKESQDSKKAKAYTKFLRLITAAVRKTGDENPDHNAALRLAIQQAKSANVPKENIKRAIQKGSKKEGPQDEEVSYEGYGPGGVAFLIDCMSDNLNRTVAFVRSVFRKYGGSLAKNGSISHLFSHKGSIEIEKKDLNPGADGYEDLSLEWIEWGAEEIIEEEKSFQILLSFHDFGPMQKHLDEKNIPIASLWLGYIPHTTIETSEKDFEKNQKIIENLEENDDIQSVYHNLEAP